MPDGWQRIRVLQYFTHLPPTQVFLSENLHNSSFQVLSSGKTWNRHTTSYQINNALICPPIQMNTTTCKNRANPLDSWDGHTTNYRSNDTLKCPPTQMNTPALQVLPQGKTWDGHKTSYQINNALICPPIQMNTTTCTKRENPLDSWDGHTTSYRINHALICPSLDQPLRYHSICDFHEASDICAYHVVHPVAFFCAELYRRVVGVRMNVHHDSMEFFVNLLGSP